MRTKAHAAVMFVDICDSTTLYERLGDASAYHLLSAAIQSTDTLIKQHEGQVVKHIGDGILAIFSRLEQAAECAIQIHQSSNRTAASPAVRMKIGIRAGSVFLENADVFGDTVNTAARIVSMATPGQTLAGSEISGIQLKSGVIRSIGFHRLKGKQNTVEIHELLGTQPRGITTCVAPSRKRQRQKRLLRLCFEAIEINMGLEQRMSIGRGERNTLQIDHPLVSREHAEIEGKSNRFVLRDLSTNGLILIASDSSEYALHREGMTLSGTGEIHLGTQSTSSDNAPIIHFMHIEE